MRNGYHLWVDKDGLPNFTIFTDCTGFASSVTQEMREQYTSDGLVVLRNVLTRELASRLLNVSQKVYQMTALTSKTIPKHRD